MATRYKLYPNESNGREVPAIQRILDNGRISSIPTDPANADYADYLKWVAAGNTAEAAD
tara:strand:- start:123 stop:299 length:177 start_codon:yes stop_codon:yes gene_type:complete